MSSAVLNPDGSTSSLESGRPGDISTDGRILSTTHGWVSAGILWVRRPQSEIAEKLGWKVIDFDATEYKHPDDLVKVSRGHAL